MPLDRVTSVPGTTIPSPATAALRTRKDGLLECDICTIPAGSTVYFSCDLSTGSDAGDGLYGVELNWAIGGDITDYTDPITDVSIPGGWTHLSGSMAAPNGSEDGVRIAVDCPGQTTGYLYGTNFSLSLSPPDLAFAAVDVLALAESAVLTFSDSMAAVDVLALAESAWLTAMPHGYDTLVASDVLALGGWARLSSSEDLPLPATDAIGWISPSVAVPAIRGFSVSGLTCSVARITDFVIELDNAGGCQSATISVDDDMMRAPAIFSKLVITYPGATPMHFRLEHIAANVGSTAGYTLTYGPAMAALRDHKGYKCTFVDSDLANVKTDQGPRSSPDTFEVASRSSGATA